MIEKYENDYDDLTLREIDPEELSGSLSPFTFICITFILILMGLVMAYSASYDAAIRNGMKHYHYLLEMVTYGVLGIVAGLLFFFASRKRLETISRALFPISLVFLVVTLVHRIIGNTAAYDPTLPVVRISPVIEFTTVLFLASVLPAVRKRDRRGWLYVAITVSFLLIISSLIYLGYYSDALLYAIILMILASAGGIEKKYVFTVSIFMATLVVFRFLASPTHMEMIFERMMPRVDGPAASQVAYDSVMAIAEGGVRGKGIGNGYYKLGVIPGIHTDYIFANLAEECGILGIIIVSLFFVLFMFLGLRAASRAKLIEDDFVRIASLGFTYLIIFKVLLSMAVTSGILPSNGIGLPFFSSNGPENFLTMLEASLLYRFIHMTGRGYERLR